MMALKTKEELYQVLREDGSLIDKKREPEISDEELKGLHRIMLFTRLVDERLLKMQRQGRIGFYIASTGEEATHIGSTFAMDPQDWIFPQYRESGSAFMRGFSLKDFVCQMLGNSGDLIKGRQMPSHYAYKKGRYLSVSSPIATQIPQAVGFAWGGKIRKEKFATLVFFGDGSTSHGDFHVGLNFAGVFKAPVVFLCRNNQWAISVPISRQTASESIAIKAVAYGIEGVRVDGNDILAVIQVTKEAARKARAGLGPTLIEALTYRMGPHSTSDDPRIYANESEIEQWKNRDPLARFQKYLQAKSLWNAKQNEELIEQINNEISKTIEEAESLPSVQVESLFDDVYAELLPNLKEQRDELLGEVR